MAPDQTKHSRPTTWILLRGLARERGHWGPFLDELKDGLGSDEEVLALDLPGVGEFADQPSPRSLAGIAAFVRDRARERAPGARIHLLTISLGAMVGFEWLRAWPTEVDGLVVINTSLANLSPFYQRLRWQIWPKFVKLSSIQPPRERERAIIDLLINDPAAQARAWPTWTKLAQERPIPYATFANQLWAATRGGGPLVTNGRPGLILSALGDRFVDPSCSTALAEATGWPIARHPWGGHDLPWDDAPWVIERLRQWRAGADSSKILEQV